MREAQRIDRIMTELTRLWKLAPDWRFYQLLINLGLHPNDSLLWNIEDDFIEGVLTTQKVIR
jgi:hypothetical protein